MQIRLARPGQRHTTQLPHKVTHPFPGLHTPLGFKPAQHLERRRQAHLVPLAQLAHRRHAHAGREAACSDRLLVQGQRALVIAPVPCVTGHRQRCRARGTGLRVAKQQHGRMHHPRAQQRGRLPCDLFTGVFEHEAHKHRAGLRRLVALQLKEPLKYLEKNIPDLQKMAVAYMSLGTQEELRDQIIDVALERAFLAEPLPADEAGFKARVDEGRSRLNLIAQEVARLAVQWFDRHLKR